MTLLRLSNNGIRIINEDAFNALTNMKTLQLDHNQISSHTITANTFNKLQNLEVLILSNNALGTLNGTWFANLKKLKSLHLNGNMIQKIEENIFASLNHYELKILDLSNNFISYVSRTAFVGLLQLNVLELSRNNLTVLTNPFSHLLMLTILSLDLNHWNCSCELVELAVYLRNYVQNTLNLLKNAKDLNCETSKNPEILNILQLTKDNCKPATQSMNTLHNNRIHDLYVRDIVLVAVFCFAGAIGLTFAILSALHWKYQHATEDSGTSEEFCQMSFIEQPSELNQVKQHIMSFNEQHSKPAQVKQHIVTSNGQLSNSSNQTMHITKGFPSCDFTCENEMKSMALISSRNEPVHLQETQSQQPLKSICRTKGTSALLAACETAKDSDIMDTYFMCLNCKLVQLMPMKFHKNKIIETDTSVPSRNTHMITTKFKSIDVQQLGKLDTGMYQEMPKEGYMNKKETSQIHQYENANTNPLEVKERCNSTKQNKHMNVNSKEEERFPENEVLQHDQATKDTAITNNKTLIFKCIHCNKLQKQLRPIEGVKVKPIKTSNCSKTSNAVPILNFTEESMMYPVKAVPPRKSVHFDLPESEIEQNVEQSIKKWKTFQSKHLIRKSPKAHDNTLQGFEENDQSDLSIKKKQRTEKPDEKSEKDSASITEANDLLTVKLNLHPFRKVRVYPTEIVKKHPTSSDSSKPNQHSLHSKKRAPTASNSMASAKAKIRDDHCNMESEAKIVEHGNTNVTTRISGLPRAPSKAKHKKSTTVRLNISDGSLAHDDQNMTQCSKTTEGACIMNNTNVQHTATFSDVTNAKKTSSEVASNINGKDEAREKSKEGFVMTAPHKEDTNAVVSSLVVPNGNRQQNLEPNAETNGYVNTMKGTMQQMEKHRIYNDTSVSETGRSETGISKKQCNTSLDLETPGSQLGSGTVQGNGDPEAEEKEEKHSKLHTAIESVESAAERPCNSTEGIAPNGAEEIHRVTSNEKTDRLPEKDNKDETENVGSMIPQYLDQMQPMFLNEISKTTGITGDVNHTRAFNSAGRQHNITQQYTESTFVSAENVTVHQEQANPNMPHKESLVVSQQVVNSSIIIEEGTTKELNNSAVIVRSNGLCSETVQCLSILDKAERNAIGNTATFPEAKSTINNHKNLGLKSYIANNETNDKISTNREQNHNGLQTIDISKVVSGECANKTNGCETKDDKTSVRMMNYSQESPTSQELIPSLIEKTSDKTEVNNTNNILPPVPSPDDTQSSQNNTNNNSASLITLLISTPSYTEMSKIIISNESKQDTPAEDCIRTFSTVIQDVNKENLLHKLHSVNADGKKICLVLPEKTNSNSTTHRQYSRKIK
ncbi:leucine-rich repeat-containing protein 53 [Protopterus annectens]|uniref:leucine-rich repeat-containing protein 53 n=1 Tax=Protopterus annectens TaxID=7888 RepID=UPI001CF9F006|nr:leucine-rich repeat-containing protein 53 [Protopterus annectens]